MTAARSAAGRLVLVATPIGNLGDLSPRAVEALRDADLVCCEDTRRTRVLLSASGITGRRLLAVHQHNERARAELVVERLRAGACVAVVTDAGTPGLSDPGALLVRAAVRAGHAVTVVPGPDAASAALVVSGLPADRWCFEGFLPRRGRHRHERLQTIAREERTTVLFEAPGRLVGTLVDLAGVCGGGREVAVVRELTKQHEEIWRGSLAAATTVFAERQQAGTLRGEVVVVVGPAPAGDGAPDAEAVAVVVARYRAAGSSARDAAAAAAAELGVPRRVAYEAAVTEGRRPEWRSPGSLPTAVPTGGHPDGREGRGRLER